MNDIKHSSSLPNPEGPKEISIPYWWTCNGRMIARWALDWDHKESEYQYILNVLKLVPENYGVYKNPEQYRRFKEMTHEQLVQECMHLTDLVRSAEKAGLL